MNPSPPVIALTSLGVFIVVVGFLAAGSFWFTALGLTAIALGGVLGLAGDRARAFGGGAGNASPQYGDGGPQMAAEGKHGAATAAAGFMFVIGAVAGVWLAVVWVSIANHDDPGSLPTVFGAITAAWIVWLGVAAGLYRRSQRAG